MAVVQIKKTPSQKKFRLQKGHKKDMWFVQETVPPSYRNFKTIEIYYNEVHGKEALSYKRMTEK